MKKLLAIGGIIVIVFALIVILSNKADNDKLKNNPYDTDKLEKSTIALIGNENYENIILPEELFKKTDAGESVTAYFFSPECQYCMEMTPILMPIAKEMGVHVYQYNMLEYLDQAKAKYGIDSWPTLIHFRDGKEVGRMVGLQPEENIRMFFNEFESK